MSGPTFPYIVLGMFHTCILATVVVMWQCTVLTTVCPMLDNSVHSLCFYMAVHTLCSYMAYAFILRYIPCASMWRHIPYASISLCFYMAVHTLCFYMTVHTLCFYTAVHTLCFYIAVHTLCFCMVYVCFVSFMQLLSGFGFIRLSVHQCERVNRYRQ